MGQFRIFIRKGEGILSVSTVGTLVKGPFTAHPRGKRSLTSVPTVDTDRFLDENPPTVKLWSPFAVPYSTKYSVHT